MKLLLILLLAPVLGFSQIEIQKSPASFTVGKIKSGGITLAELSYTIGDDKDTVFTLMYKNQEYTSLVDYQALVFNSEGNTLSSFYAILKSFFTDENRKNKDYKAEFKLGKENVTASNYRMLGNTSVMLFGRSGYCFLNEKQVDKLFGN